MGEKLDLPGKDVLVQAKAIELIRHKHFSRPVEGHRYDLVRHDISFSAFKNRLSPAIG